jgi:L-glyceraldehyde 3-phosphate reductase
MLASLDQSLRRMQLEYVDIFYHHRPDPETPLEESMLALDQSVRQGKALYVGISAYNPEETRAALKILRELRTPVIIHQPRYSMFDRRPEDGLLDVLAKEGLGCIVFSPLEQGLLTDKYLKGIPKGSRASKPHGALRPDDITDERRAQLVRLNEIARARGHSLAQLAIAWVLRHEVVTSALIGASRVAQVEDGVAALDNLFLSGDELRTIEQVLTRT